jgi:putative DNA primase/helicase
LAELAGKRLNVVSELPERDILESERFKAVVTGDPLTAARKFRDPFTLVPTAGHLFACNALPATRDQSYGFWRRPIVLPFAHRFTKTERVRDYHLTILATELGEIAAWAVEGAARVQAKGEYTLAEPSAEAKRFWQIDTDQVRQFLEDCARGDASAQTSLVDLYCAYTVWAKETGHGGMSRNALGSRLRGLGHGARSALGRFYRLALQPDWVGDGLKARQPQRQESRYGGGRVYQ